jgi:hypothetical protein
MFRIFGANKNMLSSFYYSIKRGNVNKKKKKKNEGMYSIIKSLNNEYCQE